MKEIEALKTLISSLKAYSVFGDVAIALILIIGILLTYFWQKKKIESLKDYIELWRPTHLKTELESFLDIKKEINKTTVEQYKKELQESKDKEEDALRIINDLQQKNSELLSKLMSQGTVTLMDIAPSGGEAIVDREQDPIMWTIKFRNGTIKRFKFPITKKS